MTPETVALGGSAHEHAAVLGLSFVVAGPPAIQYAPARWLGRDAYDGADTVSSLLQSVAVSGPPWNRLLLGAGVVLGSAIAVGRRLTRRVDPVGFMRRTWQEVDLEATGAEPGAASLVALSLRGKVRMSSLWIVALATCLSVEAHAQESSPPPPSASARVVTAGATRPAPWIWNRMMLAVSGWPSGAIIDGRVQYRAALTRRRSFVLHDTFAGAGARVAVTPAFVDVGPRLSVAPIDFFDVDLQAGFVGYWPSSSGLLPYSDVSESTRDQDRTARHKDPTTAAKSGWAVYASLQPTLKAKVGPIMLYDSWAFTFFHVARTGGDDSPFVYEPYWDRLIAENDLIFQQEVGLLGEVLKGDRDHPRLTLGAQFRHRWTLVSHDPSMVVGGTVMLKVVDRAAVPAIAGQVLAYVKDADRVGGVPTMGLALVWANDLRPPASKARRPHDDLATNPAGGAR